MIENFNYHRNYHVNQGVWHDYGLILEGIMRFEHEKSILFEFSKNKESYIPIFQDIKHYIMEKGKRGDYSSKI